MSFYQKIAEIGSKYMGKDKVFKYGFNLSPMYRRSTAKITEVSKDLLRVKVKLPISYKNKNYVNSIFGGSMFSAVDPIPMVQLINIMGEKYAVWDKAAEIFFRIPAKEDVYAEFIFTQEEIEAIKNRVDSENEIIITSLLTNKDKSKTYCEVRKRIYIANKSFYREKREKKKKERQQG